MEADQKQAIRIAAAFFALCGLMVGGILLLGPEAARIGTEIFGGGIGLKDAAILSFFVTTGLFVVLAVVAGDGLLGELQYLLGAYFSFYVIFWLLLAWIF